MAVAGPGLGNYGDYYNPTTKKVDVLAGPGYGRFGEDDKLETINKKKPSVLGDSSDNSGFSANSYAKTLGYGSADEAKSALGVSSLEDYYNSQKKTLADQKAKQNKQAIEIGNAWNPIFSELDRMLGSIPTQQTNYENKIGESTNAQLSDVESSRVRSEEALQTEKKRGLRSLEEDIRNQLDAAGTMLGVAGAGSSSAVGQASEAVARVGQKARGNLQETVATKLTEINNLASTERSKINQWKSDKLFEITSYFGDKINELNMQKANAQKERKQAVEELIFNVEQEFMSSLKDLDSKVFDYAQTVDMWEKNRAAELEDYNRTQRNNAAVSPEKIAQSLSIFNSLIEQGASEQQAREWMQAQGVYNLPDDLESPAQESPDSVFTDQGTTVTEAPGTDPLAGLFDDLGTIVGY